jgi:hypothetical protein
MPSNKRSRQIELFVFSSGQVFQFSHELTRMTSIPLRDRKTIIHATSHGASADTSRRYSGSRLSPAISHSSTPDEYSENRPRDFFGTEKSRNIERPGAGFASVDTTPVHEDNHIKLSGDTHVHIGTTGVIGPPCFSGFMRIGNR